MQHLWPGICRSRGAQPPGREKSTTRIAARRQYDRDTQDTVNVLPLDTRFTTSCTLSHQDADLLVGGAQSGLDEDVARNGTRLTAASTRCRRRKTTLEIIVVPSRVSSLKPIK